MGDGRRPNFRLTLSRKDKAEITFTDYKGETVSKRHCPIGVAWENEKFPGSYNVKLDKKVTIDPEVFYLNIFGQDDDQGERPAKRAPKGRKQESSDDGQDPFGNE